VPSGHGITDAADNPLADPNPTGADHTYTVDTAAPTVASIERSDPAEATTSERTLVFGVTFSEDVTGVDQADFVLSSGGTGTGSVTNLAGSGSQYLVNVSAAQYGTYNLDIVPNSGITDMAGNPLADGDPLVDQSFSCAGSSCGTRTYHNAGPDSQRAVRSGFCSRLQPP
jgi:hypothetical protein